MQYTRRVFEGPKLIKNERYTVRYDAQNAIVEVGPPRARAKPKAPPEASTENGESTEEPPADDIQPPKAE